MSGRKITPALCARECARLYVHLTGTCPAPLRFMAPGMTSPIEVTTRGWPSGGDAVDVELSMGEAARIACATDIDDASRRILQPIVERVAASKGWRHKTDDEWRTHPPPLDRPYPPAMTRPADDLRERWRRQEEQSWHLHE